MSGLKSRVLGAAFAGLLLCGGFAVAKEVKVAPGDPPLTIDVPSSWEVSEIKRGIQAKTADDEVFLWIETYVPAQFETLLKEHNAYFKEQGVTITGEPEQTEKDYPGYAIKVSTYPAKDEDGPTVIRYLSIGPKDESKRRILLSYWASPDGDKTYDADTNKILDSLRASVEKE